ncbi:hypothetical protein [Prosthecobacter sp.]|uniref:hypothetical protein n=1 Tax=Prosthecobacter sp. TaxID=1965333 RepID=UPI003784C840
MKTLRLALLTLLCLSSAALARIGETQDECIRRYGEPVQRDADKTLSFRKSGIAVTCTFLEGRCVHIRYQKLDPDARLNGREVDILRAANGTHWKLQGGNTSSYSTMRNETCECRWDYSTGVLEFETLTEVNRKKQDTITAEKKLLEGF